MPFSDEDIKALLKPHHDATKIATLVATLIGCGVLVAGIFIAIGRNQSSVEKIDRIESKQIQQQDDITSIRYESKGANAGVQRVEQKVDDGLKDINTQLRQLNVRHHQ